MFNTVNINFGYCPLRYGDNKFNYFVSGRAGIGVLESEYNDALISWTSGLEVEAESKGITRNEHLKFFWGLGFGYLFPKGNFTDGMEIDPFIGARYYFVPRSGKIRFAVQAKFGVPFHSGADFLTDDDYPFAFYGAIGTNVLFKISKKRKIKEVNYLGAVEVYKESDTARITKPRFEPLPLGTLADTIFEKKVYLEGKPDFIPAIPNVDVSDIKLLRFIYDARSSIDRFSPNFFYKVNDQSQDSMMLLIAMFDKDRCETDLIGNNNMYLVFNDLNKSRYFGFTYDINKRLQPETAVKDELDVSSDDPYYGYYEDYIQKLHWLDTDVLPLTMHSIDGKEVEGDILRYFDLFNARLKEECEAQGVQPYEVTRDNFRFAYAVYPEETFEKIKKACKNFGVSIMFRYDVDKSNTTESKIFGFSDAMGGGMIVDPDDAAFFSNLIHGSDIFSPCTGEDMVIDAFDLGKATLTVMHIKHLKTVKRYDCAIKEVAGYTDKVEFQSCADFMNSLASYQDDQVVKSCLSLNEQLGKLIKEWQAIRAEDEAALPPDELCQRGLAWKRIRSVMEELQKFGFDIRLIATNPVGIEPYPYDVSSNPGARKVIISFSN